MSDQAVEKGESAVSNQSDGGDSAGQSADDVLKTSKHHDLHTRMSQIFYRELEYDGDDFCGHLADVLIRELELEVTVTSESNDGRFRSFAIEGYWEIVDG